MQEKSRIFDPDKNFFQLPVFWFVVGATLIIIAAVSLTIYLSSNLEPNWTYQGFNNFVSYFRVPIGIFVYLIPIVALLTAIHRSEQSRATIQQAEYQNNFNNHYKHLEEFGKYLENERTNNTDNFSIKVPTFHRIIFPHTKKGITTHTKGLEDALSFAIDNIIYFPELDSQNSGITDYGIRLSWKIRDLMSGGRESVEYKGNHRILEENRSISKIFKPPHPVKTIFYEPFSWIELFVHVINFESDLRESKLSIKIRAAREACLETNDRVIDSNTNFMEHMKPIRDKYEELYRIYSDIADAINPIKSRIIQADNLHPLKRISSDKGKPGHPYLEEPWE